MAAEVANNQAIAVPATEENAAEKKVIEDIAADVKDDAVKAAEDAKNASGENHADGAAAATAAAQPAKVTPPKVNVHKADFEKDVIYLYQFSRTPFLPSISPYCLKVETWLRLAGLKYEVSADVGAGARLNVCGRRMEKGDKVGERKNGREMGTVSERVREG